jgi:hypothetical protein
VWQPNMHGHMQLCPVCGMALQQTQVLVARRSPGAASVRGSGQLVGEVSLFEAGGPGAVWQTSVRASVATAALRLTAAHLRSLLSSRPEAEAAVRAGAASPTLRGARACAYMVERNTSRASSPISSRGRRLAERRNPLV